MTDTHAIFFFQLTNQIINRERKAKRSRTNYLAHTRQNVESFLSQMQYITWLNLKQSWKSQCMCVCITCSTPDAAYRRKDDSAICCASLCNILMSSKVCIPCQSLAHSIESKLMEVLHLHCKCYTLHDNLNTMMKQINASKCSVVLRNMYRSTPSIDWRQIHTQNTFPFSVS